MLITQSQYGVLDNRLAYLRIITHYIGLLIHILCKLHRNHHHVYLFDIFVFCAIDNNTFDRVYADCNRIYTSSKTWGPTLAVLISVGKE